MPPSTTEVIPDNGPGSAQIPSAEPSRHLSLAPPASSAAPPDFSSALPDTATTGPPSVQLISSYAELVLSSSLDPADPRPDPTPVTNPITSSEPPTECIARSKAPRNTRTPSWLNDFVSHTARCFDSPPLITSPTPFHSSGTSHPLEHFLTYLDIDATQLSFLAAIDSDTEPRTYLEAPKDPRWRLAMADEIRALEDNCT
ncbi:hypothetical protein CRG98_007566 [Punica granatum]|uniref:Uncharacterized protein n=1 Tax=Punica granatum TaxID=22663 RepID=A0A2I0KUL4_PUNGR|nr:hypothetical protein CRG98_007566 [Punica granatum]